MNKHIVGVEEYFLHDTYTQFYNPTQIDTEFTYDAVPGSSYGDVIKSLYVNAGQGKNKLVYYLILIRF